MNILEKICQLKHKEINLLKKKFKPSQQKLKTRGFLKSILVKDYNKQDISKNIYRIGSLFIIILYLYYIFSPFARSDFT